MHIFFSCTDSLYSAISSFFILQSNKVTFFRTTDFEPSNFVILSVPLGFPVLNIHKITLKIEQDLILIPSPIILVFSGQL